MKVVPFFRDDKSLSSTFFPIDSSQGSPPSEDGRWNFSLAAILPLFPIRLSFFPRRRGFDDGFEFEFTTGYCLAIGGGTAAATAAAAAANAAGGGVTNGDTDDDRQRLFRQNRQPPPRSVHSLGFFRLPACDCFYSCY